MPYRSRLRGILGFSGVGLLLMACTGTISESVPGADPNSPTGAGATAGSSSGSSGSSGKSGSSGGSGGSGTGGSGSGGDSSGSGGSSSGSSGSSGASGSTGNTGGAPSQFGECPTDDAAPGVTPLSKLSSAQYRNTVVDLLAAQGLEDVASELATELASVPDDTLQSQFRGLDKRISANHVNAYFTVAVSVGDAVTSSSARLTALAGDCATDASLSTGCLDAFLGDFARRALRRPLTDEELDQYRDIALGDSPQAADAAEALRNVVVSLLMSPRFVNHLELEGTPVGGAADYLALDPYEIASRLSYTFWQTLPDDELLAAAEDGSLGSDAGFTAQLDRVFEDPRTQATIWQFWNEWFRFDTFTGFSAERPAFQALAEGQFLGESGHEHWADMVQEVRDLTDLYTWKGEGTLLELMTSDVSVTRSDDLARLYGVDAWSGSGAYPTLPSGTRQGILLRSALLVSSLETTNPFHRGSMIRRAILCETLDPPDPTTLPAGSLDPPPPSDELTTRERFDAKVAGNALCRGCHAVFSGIGYALEAYDSLGRFRTEELVFDEESGDLLATLPVDTLVENLQIGDEAPAAMDGPLALNQRIIESGKLEACLSANYFRYALRREPSTGSADACAYDRMRTGLVEPGVSLAQVFKSIGAEPAFRSRKVGAP
jgi:hypothetical protein